MKAVIYARYSSDNQREESIEGQLRECTEFATKKGLTVISSYIDRALSAKTDNRPEFQRMIRDSSKRLFDVIIVWKLDRFARNRYDSAHYKALLRKNGIKVVSATEAISEDSTGILLESLLEGYAEFYSAELFEKVKRGLTENALKCKCNGGYVTYGYTVDEGRYFQIDPTTAPVVLEIFKKYAGGSIIKEIVDDLNIRGVKTLRNGKFTIHIVTDLLKNRRFMGEYRFGDVIVPGGMPVIVPEDLFMTVQARMEQNKRAPARFKAEDRYLLTTKLFCGKCGAFMAGESGTSKTERKYHYYKCGNAKRHKGCNKKAVKKLWIENLVVDNTMKMLFDDDLISYIVDTLFELQSKESTTIPLLQQQLSETEKGIDNMLNAIQQGVLTASTKERLEALENTKARLEISILQEQIKKPLLTKEQMRFWICKFRNLNMSEQDDRERLIESFVNAVYVYDDKVVLTFNYKKAPLSSTLIRWRVRIWVRPLRQNAKDIASHRAAMSFVFSSPRTRYRTPKFFLCSRPFQQQIKAASSLHFCQNRSHTIVDICH